MKITWIQDYDIMTHPGGAQFTDRAHFLDGIRRGHDLNLLTPSTGLDSLFPESSRPDMIIASNPLFMTVDEFNKIREHEIPYAYFFHDYWPLCKYRLFYPMKEECQTTCYMKERWLETLEKAKMLIWLSPLHRDSWLWACPNLMVSKHAIVPSPVNPDKFFPMDLERKGAIAIESLHEFKGRDNVLEWMKNNPEVPVTFTGGNPMPDMPLPPNCTYYEWVPQHQLNELLNQHEALLHLPETPMPFDRTVAEAYLAGCKIIGNSLIGAMSFPWFTDRESVREHLKGSSTLFWESVEEVFDGG